MEAKSNFEWGMHVDQLMFTTRIEGIVDRALWQKERPEDEGSMIGIHRISVKLNPIPINESQQV